MATPATVRRLEAPSEPPDSASPLARELPHKLPTGRHAPRRLSTGPGESDAMEDGEVPPDDDFTLVESRKKKGSKHDAKAALVVVIDGIDGLRFNGKIAMLKELQRIQPGFKAANVLLLQRGGIAVTCASEDDKSRLLESPLWEEGLPEAAFGGAKAHAPRSVDPKGGRHQHPVIYDERCKVVFDYAPREATEEDLREALPSSGVVKIVQFASRRPDSTSWMVEMQDESSAKELVENGALLYGLVLKCRPCRGISRPLRCSKCQRFGHAGTACPHEFRCPDCSGPHAYGDASCPVKHPPDGTRIVKICPNCSAAGHPDTDHSAGWAGCPEAKTERRVLYSVMVQKQTDDRAAAKQPESYPQPALTESPPSDEVTTVCSRVFSDMLVKLLISLLSSMIGDVLKSPNPLERQSFLLEQFEAQFAGLVDLSSVRSMFKLPNPTKNK